LENINQEGKRPVRPRAGLTLALIWAYISAVFLVDEPGLPLNIGLWLWLLSIVIAFILGNVLAGRAVRRGMLSEPQLSNLNIFGGTVFVCLIVLDIAYSMYINSTASSFDIMKSRVFDENVWVSELYPKVYYPTERNFALHKPNVTVAGSPFGNFYSAPMLNSPTLTGSVLEQYPIEIRINELGFRESSDISAADIFTLGDSFTFGWGVNETESWPGLLESQLDEPIYNLGIHDASPKQELELLTYVLREQGENIRIRKLLWMIYEGNDLEDDYTEKVLRHDAPMKVPLTKGTLIGTMEGLMRTIKRQSVIHKLRRGQITWKTSIGDVTENPYSVDGVSLVYPLYFSPQLGSRLFARTFVDLAGESSSYVENHWNRSALKAVFQDMKSLADEYDFEVAVVMAPSASRLHGPFFENFPEISAAPHFIDFVAELSDSAGFDMVNLYELMKPYAGTELLYFRDDDHFNRRGHIVTAEFIQQEVFAD
jgi:lysophospholipase L1-like esterase